VVQEMQRVTVENDDDVDQGQRAEVTAAIKQTASPDFSYRVGFRVAVTRRTTEPMTRVRGCGLK
jgi:hypothetical protein